MIVISISALIVLLICYIIYKNTRSLNAIPVLFAIGLILIVSALAEILDFGAAGMFFCFLVSMLIVLSWIVNNSQQQ